MNATKFLPVIAVALLSGCNYDLTNQFGGNTSGGGELPGLVTDATPDVAPVVDAVIEEVVEVEPVAVPEPVAAVEEAVDAEPEVEEEAGCDSCSERTIDLAWMPEGSATGYRIFYGPNSNAVDQLLGDLNELTPEFDLDNPAVSYHAWYDMGLMNGDSVCFSIESYDSDDNTTVLGAACGVISA